MVGVPGRSKGCNTCRRRKLGCDLAKPSCERCLKSGRTCEGYDRGLVFLNRTPKGMVKRGHLEEVTTYQLNSSAGISQPLAIQAQLVACRLPPQITHNQVVKLRLEEVFLERYFSSKGRLGWNPPTDYLREITLSPYRDPVLDTPFRAFWMTRLGYMTGNPDLYAKGTQSYGTALRWLFGRLSDASPSLDDEVIVTAHILSLYELYEATPSTFMAHDSHIAGITKLLQRRGKTQSESRLFDMVLQAVKANAVLRRALLRILDQSNVGKMIFSVQYLKRSPLDDAEWRSKSRNTIDDFESSLCDIGLATGSLLEDITTFAERYEQPGKIPSPSTGSEFSALVKRTLDLLSLHETWWNDLSNWAPKPLYRREPISEKCEFYVLGNLFTPRPTLESSCVVYQDIRLAHICMDYWAIQLILCIIMGRTRDQMPMIARLMPSVQRLLTVAARHDENFQLGMATNILDSCNYTMRPEMGLIGPQKSLFSLRVALTVFRAHSGSYAETQAEKAGELLRGLEPKCGLRYAKDLESTYRVTWIEQSCSKRRLPDMARVSSATYQ